MGVDDGDFRIEVTCGTVSLFGTVSFIFFVACFVFRPDSLSMHTMIKCFAESALCVKGKDKVPYIRSFFCSFLRTD